MSSQPKVTVRPPEQFTFRMRWQFIAMVALVMLVPRLVLLVLFWEKGLATVFWEAWLPAFLVKLVFIAALHWWPIRVVLNEEGIRLMRFWRLEWADVTGARVRTSLGFRVLELTRRRGRRWQFLLVIYKNLRAILSAYAPDGNPLKDLARQGVAVSP